MNKKDIQKIIDARIKTYSNKLHSENYNQDENRFAVEVLQIVKDEIKGFGRKK